MGAFNGSGIFNRSYNWQDDADNGVDIEPARMDTEDDGFATGLSACVTRDGQSPATANLPMGGFKHTGVANSTARNQYAASGQVQDGAFLWGGTTSGTSTAFTASVSPAITAYAAGQTFRVIFDQANGSSPTINFNGVGAKNLTKQGNTALAASDISAGAVVEMVYDGTQFQVLNIAISAGGGGSDIQNLGLTASVGSNQVTFALKGANGSDASSTNPVVVNFRSATVTSALPSSLTISSALSLVITNGSTMGTVNSIAFSVWLVLFNDGGTPRLGAIVTRSGSNILGLNSSGVASSTAEGGAGGADSAQVFYTDSAVTSKAYRVLGRFDWDSGLSTAGTWASGPTRGELFGQDVPLPGMRIDRKRTATTSNTNPSPTTPIPWDNSIPQNTEGSDLGNVLDQEYTPKAAPNLIRVTQEVALGHSSVSGSAMIVALFVDSTADALTAKADIADTDLGQGGVGQYTTIRTDYETIAASTTTRTYKTRVGLSSSNTNLLFNHGSSKNLGGLVTSSIVVEEYQV